MEPMIEEILRDLYALDEELIQYDTHLRKALKKIIESKPNTQFDENFKLRLRTELMEKVSALQSQKAQEKRSAWNWGGIFSSRWALAAPALAVVLVAVFLGYGQYEKNGGIFLTKQNVKFALTPTIEDVIGVDPSSRFILRTSKDLSAATVEKVVIFDPEVDFRVEKIRKVSSIFSVAYATADEMQPELPFQYEVIPNKALDENEIYKIAIKNEQIADRDYQWAYQIKAPFGVTESTPKNKDNYIATDIGIEIKFNRPLPDNMKEYFSISPNVEGSLEKKYDTIYFVPKKLDEKKVYTVTIKKGMVSLGDGEILENDYSFSFETRRAEDSEDKDEFELVDVLTTVNTSMHPMIGVSGENKEEFELKLYALGGADNFMDSYAASRNTDLSWTEYAQTKNIDEYLPKEDKKIFSANAKLVDNIFFEIPQNLEEGYYLYEMKKGKKRQAGWIVSTNVAHYYSLLQDSSLFWIYDFASKKAIEKTKVSFIGGKEELVGETDADGVLRFQTPSELKNEELKDPRFFKIDAPGAKPIVIFANENGYFMSENNEYWHYLSVDKNKYRTTDTINYWGILKGRKSNIQGKKLSVGLYRGCPGGYIDKNSTQEEQLPLVSQVLDISDADTLNGKLSFSGVKVGSYCLVAMDVENKKILVTRDISVETYDKPIYQIKVESSKKAIFTGEELIFKVKADFYDGTPLASQELKYQIGYSGEEKKIRLNSFGEAEVRYTPKYDEEAYYPIFSSIRFSPVLGEEGDIWGEAAVQVFGADMEISSEVKRVNSQKYEFNVDLKKVVLDNYVPDDQGRTYRKNGQSYLGPNMTDYEIKGDIMKITYEKEEGDEYYDFITKTKKRNYNYKEKQDKIGEISGRTDVNGNWKLVKDFEVSQDVSYRIDFNAEDAKSKKASSSSYVYFGMNNNNPIELEMQGGQNAYYNGQEFSFGDNVQLTLKTKEDDKVINGKMLIYRYQNNIDAVSVLDGNSFQEAFQEAFSPSATYQAVVLTQYGFQESPSITAKLKEEDRKLDIEITPTQKGYRPGEEAKIQIAIKDRSGKPVSTEVNVSVVDEALFQNNIDWNENVLTKLYEKIFANPVTGYTEYASRKYGDGMGGGGDDRSVFLDVVHFVSIKTDVDGRATTSFKMPDNLTGWRITARAFDTKEMTAGQNNTVVSTSLPFFVEATVNGTYLTGDEPQLKMRFFGTDYDASQPVEYVISSAGLKLDQKNSTQERINYVSLGKLAKGDYEIRVEARQGEKKDAVIRKIKVVDSYAQKQESHAYKISPELKNIQGNEASYTDLVFVDFGKAKFFSTLSASAGEIGVRLDQVVSTYLAKKLLAKHYYGKEFKEDLSIDAYTKSKDKEADTSGGLGLLNYGSEDLALSAKVADGIQNNTALDGLEEYFNDAMYNSKADIHRISKALYGLAAMDKAVLSKINIVKKNKNDLTLEDKIYIGLGLVKSGDMEGARAYYREQIKEAVKVEGGLAWIDASEGSTEKEKITATLGMLVSELDEREMSEKVWSYLDMHSPQRDLIVLERALMAKAQLAVIKDEPGEFVLRTNNRKENIILGKDNQQTTVSLSQEELASLTFDSIKGDVEVISLVDVPLKTENISNDANLKLTRVYKLGEVASSKFFEGDLVKITLTPQFPEGVTEEGYQVTDVLPSGLKLATAKFDPLLMYSLKEGAIEANKCSTIWYPEAVDGNRVTFSLNRYYAKDNNCQEFTINYYARVVSRGTFKADAPILQATSYFNSYFIAPSSQIEIK